VNVDGKELLTIEGLGTVEQPLHPVQQTMLDHGAVQCGFCSCGVALSIKAYGDECKRENHKPSREEVKKSLEGHLCLCTGYVIIIDAAVYYL
jgi:carbon-monoxide dehydrogenase small subunit